MKHTHHQHTDKATVRIGVANCRPHTCMNCMQTACSQTYRPIRCGSMPYFSKSECTHVSASDTTSSASLTNPSETCVRQHMQVLHSMVCVWCLRSSVGCKSRKQGWHAMPQAGHMASSMPPPPRQNRRRAVQRSMTWHMLAQASRLQNMPANQLSTCLHCMPVPHDELLVLSLAWCHMSGHPH